MGRLRKICALDEDYEMNANKLLANYTKRGYPEKSILMHHRRTSQYTQNELLGKKKTKRKWTPQLW